MNYDFSISIDIAAFAVAMLSIIITIVGNVFENKRIRKKNTLDAFALLQQEALDIINTISDSEVKESIKDISSTKYAKMLNCAVRCEHFSCGVLEKIYDVKLANEIAGNYLIAIYTKLEPVINNEKTMDFSHDENLMPFHYFEKLINCYKIVNRHTRFIPE